jgi:phosphopantothenoylcysteine synthetase/decarboxylase
MSLTEGKIDRLLVGASGSVAVLGLQSYLAAFKALVAREVRVIMTDAAAGLLPPSTVALFCDGVFIDERPALQRRPGHVELARWCDAFVAIPATVNLLGQAAHGLAPNLLTSTILASPVPVIFFPNANDLMWRKRAVHRNVEILREDGHVVVDPVLTRAYEVASGQMRDNWVLPSPEQVVALVQEAHLERELSGSFTVQG